MRAKFVNADGGYQYRQIQRIEYEMQFALMPRISFASHSSVNRDTTVQLRKRRFEYYGMSKNGVIEYREVVE